MNHARITALVLAALVPTSALAQLPPPAGDAPAPPPGRPAFAPAAPRPAARDEEPPPAPTAADLLETSGGSLFRASVRAELFDPPTLDRSAGGAGLAGGAALPQVGRVSFFAVPEPEPRFIRKHDLVTIIVREQSDFQSQGQTDVKKEAELRALFEQFIGLSLATNVPAGRNVVVNSAPEISLRGSREFKGDGSVRRSDSMTARVQAEVLDVRPNGNLVLVARKRIRTDDDVQEIVLTGTCRAEDVTLDNSVLSTQMHDLDVTKRHEGTVRNATQRGRLPKLVDWIDPF